MDTMNTRDIDSTLIDTIDIDDIATMSISNNYDRTYHTAVITNNFTCHHSHLYNQYCMYHFHQLFVRMLENELSTTIIVCGCICLIYRELFTEKEEREVVL